MQPALSLFLPFYRPVESARRAGGETRAHAACTCPPRWVGQDAHQAPLQGTLQLQCLPQTRQIHRQTEPGSDLGGQRVAAPRLPMG